MYPPSRTPIDNLVSGLLRDIMETLRYKEDESHLTPEQIVEITEQQVLMALQDEIDTQVRGIVGVRSEVIAFLNIATPQQFLDCHCEKFEPQFDIMANMPAFAAPRGKQCQWPMIMGNLTQYLVDILLGELESRSWRVRSPRRTDSAENIIVED